MSETGTTEDSTGLQDFADVAFVILESHKQSLTERETDQHLSKDQGVNDVCSKNIVDLIDFDSASLTNDFSLNNLHNDDIKSDIMYAPPLMHPSNMPQGQPMILPQGSIHPTQYYYNQSYGAENYYPQIMELHIGTSVMNPEFVNPYYNPEMMIPGPEGEQSIQGAQYLNQVNGSLVDHSNGSIAANSLTEGDIQSSGAISNTLQVQKTLPRTPDDGVCSDTEEIPLGEQYQIHSLAANSKHSESLPDLYKNENYLKGDLPPHGARHMSWIIPNTKIQENRASLPAAAILRPSQPVRSSLQPGILHHFSDFKDETSKSPIAMNNQKTKTRKCCFCFPATRAGISICVFMTVIILGVLAIIGYFLFPRLPEFSPRLYRADNFFETGLNITSDPQNPANFTATLALRMNVSVYNPNLYKITFRELSLKASLQPNASALAFSGLPGTSTLTKDSIVPSTSVGSGTSMMQIFPARSTSNFSFDVTIRIELEDFLLNPYLRPDIEQACTFVNGQPTRNLAFLYVVTLRNDFLEAFGYIPTITSTSSVRCPLDENQTARIKNLLPVAQTK